MTFSILLIVLSLALLAYWFRYSCLLIVHTRTAEDFALEVSRANGLSFAMVKERLDSGEAKELAPLYESLSRDYEVLTQLLGQLNREEQQLEERLLQLNFRVTQVWFRVASAVGLKAAVSALEEMNEMVAHFANSLGERQQVMSQS
jgi:DNA-binding transcriptional MerR regulator